MKIYSRLDDILCTDRGPGNCRRVLLSEHCDRLLVDPELAIFSLNGAIEPPVD